MATRTATTAPQTATQQAEAGNGAAASWFPSRYGAGDQAGALNEITPSKVCEAVRLVGQGRVYDLAQVPLFLLALLVVRGVPVLLGLRTNGPGQRWPSGCCRPPRCPLS